MRRMTREQIKKSLQELKAANRRFEKMTPNQKRVAVAKDVLVQLGARMYKATSGIFVEVGDDDAAFVLKQTSSSESPPPAGPARCALSRGPIPVALPPSCLATMR